MQLGHLTYDRAMMDCMSVNKTTIPHGLPFNKKSKTMRTIICNSIQSFWDMADNRFLEGLNVHCVFPASEELKEFLLNCKNQYKINEISFTNSI